LFFVSDTLLTSPTSESKIPTRGIHRYGVTWSSPRATPPAEEFLI
jgi:hypothetical protein